MQLKVSVITETYLPDVNGVANSLYQLLRTLKMQQIDIQLIRTPANTFWQPEFEEVTCRGLRIPMYPDLQLGLPAGRKIRHSLLRFQPNLVFIATEGPLGASALKVALNMKLPVISAFHTNFHRYSDYYGFGLINRLLLRWLRHFHNRTQLTLVPCQEMQIELSSQGFHNVQLLPHAVDCARFNPIKRRCLWQIDKQTKVLLYVGRVAAEKNMPLLFKTYQSLQQSHKVKLVIVGDGPLASKFKSEYPEVIFCGVQTGDALAEHFASGDYFIFPSTTETFGLVTLEALASGLPVLAYDMAAAHLYVDNQMNGITVAVDDEAAFIQAAHTLLALDLSVLKQAARARAMQLSWASIGEMFIQHCSAYQNP